MRTFTLLRRNLAWYWRTNLAVAFGVATAAAVLAGALLVGDSVRASLRDLFLKRLGNAAYIVSSAGFFREELAAALPGSCPLISLEGLVTHEASGRRAGRVLVYGVDERFWKFQGYPGEAPGNREIRFSPALVDELGSKPGDSILVRVEKPSAVPLESLHGRKDDTGKTIRLTADEAAAEFSARPQQGPVRAVFLPLERLQRELDRSGRANTLLVPDGPSPEKALRDQYTLEDLGLKLRVLEKQRCLSLDSDGALIGDTVAATALALAKQLGLNAQPVLTYLANTMRVGSREIPYSLVTAMDSGPADSITLNQWAARDLGAKPGDALSLEYYVWTDAGLRTESAQFQVAKIVPVEDERDLAPEYPGITDSESLADWDPPFPLDLKRVRPQDEKYWKQYRTTPKAFIPLARGQRLWQTRFGKVTSVRIFGASLELYGKSLRAALDPVRAGLTVSPVKAQGLEASRGSTDFGEYFVYFSFFLMASALLLAGLFFRLGVEQRLREIGILRSLGFALSRIRAVFLAEGAVLALAGTVAGAAGALAYGGLVLLGLRTWWVGAVGTRLLALHVSAPALLEGAGAGVITGLGCIAWTLRRLEPVTPRGLLAGWRGHGQARTLILLVTSASALAAFGLLAASFVKRVNQTAGFFGAGTLLLIAFLGGQWLWLHSRSFASIRRHRGLARLGFRNATYRPGRSVLCVALIASAAFLIVSIEAFRRDGAPEGAGGFPLLAESILPLVRENLPAATGVTFVPFRLRPGDDASCLNLYRPRNPRVLAPPGDFLRRARFPFQEALAQTAEEKNNPWLLLDSQLPGEAIPAIADATSLTYSLHRKLGEEFELYGQRVRIVAALQDSLFQGELLISEKNFLRLFPDQPGYRFFLIDAPEQMTGQLEEALSDYGFDIVSTAERLAAFHRVENTYLSTFQTLGALGLVLGTLGLGAVLLRNVLERRRELALLRAVGYRSGHLAAMVLAENALLLALGLTTGAVCALLAIAPALSARGGHLAAGSLVLLLAVVAAAGIAASVAATAAALRSPLLPALRSE